ncbi:MAG: HesA/MoeB/ThiF family protein [Clostridia bacterium]
MNANLLRNIGAITADEQKLLKTKKVFIAGCGGLGGFLAEFSARLGIGFVSLCDKDIFDESNLNRQVFCNVYSIGKSKVNVTREKLLDINPLIKVVVEETEITSLNAESLINGSDLVIDALDNIKTRLILESACENIGIPLIFGAVDRWCGQVSTVFPKDKTISKLYGSTKNDNQPSVLAFSAAVVSSFQMAEVVKTLLGRPSLQNKVLTIDLDEYSLEILDI